MSHAILKASTRDQLGKNSKHLREKGFIPAIVYGHGFNNTNLSVKRSEFIKMYQLVGESGLFDLKIDDQEALKVIIAGIQKNPLNDQIVHIDFHKVRMDEKIKTEVMLEFIGESPAVKELGGVLVKTMDNLEIECLPTDLINKIEVDLSTLKSFDDVLRISDLKIPDHVHPVADQNQAVALVEEPKKIEEIPVESGTSVEDQDKTPTASDKADKNSVETKAKDEAATNQASAQK